jgi:hypothetical protein
MKILEALMLQMMPVLLLLHHQMQQCLPQAQGLQQLLQPQLAVQSQQHP